MASGLLVFYRWPRGTPLGFAPGNVQQVLTAASVKHSEEYEILCVRVGKEHQQQRVEEWLFLAEDVRLAEKSTSFMLMHITIEDVAMVDVLDRSFEGSCLLCRYDKSLVRARSAVAWIPGIPEPVELATMPGAATTLATLIESGLPFAPAVLQSMLACAEAFTPEARRDKKTRRQNNNVLKELQRVCHTLQSQLPKRSRGRHDGGVCVERLSRSRTCLLYTSPSPRDA